MLAIGLASLVLGPGRAEAVSYQLERAWSHPGPDGIAVDDAGRVYVTGDDRVRRYNANGKLMTAWGGTGSAPGRFNGAYGIAVTPQGNVVVADYSNDRIQVFTAGGGFIREWGVPFPWGPWDVDVDPSGTVLVTDVHNDAVHRFDSDGTYGGGTAGGSGTGDGQFEAPYGIATDRQGNFYVADTNNDRVQKFNPSGQFLAKWGRRGTARGRFTGPIGIAVHPQGRVFVGDYPVTSGRVQQFSPQGALRGKPLRSFGGGDGFEVGPLIDFDRRGNLYAAESTLGSHRIIKLRPRPFSLGKLKRNPGDGTARLIVNLPDPGRVTLVGSRQLKGASRTARRAGRLKLKVVPRGKARRELASGGGAAVKVRAKVRYKPNGGTVQAKRKRLKLVRR